VLAATDDELPPKGVAAQRPEMAKQRRRRR